MNRRQKIIISVTSIFLVLLILIGLTYAYFLTQIRGNTNERSISVSTADLKLEYGDGNGLISAVNVIPGVYVTGNDGKTFTVENKGNATVENYGIFLTDVVNTLIDTSDLVYTLTCVSKNVQTNEVSGTCNGVSSETEFPTNNSLVVTNDIAVGIKHEYRLDVLFKETNNDQSDNMNKTISAKIDLYALAGTIDIEGTVTGYQNGDYIVVNSAEPKKTIIEETETEGVGYYKVVGLLPDNHTITLYDSENTSKASTTFILNKAQSAGVSGNTITMTDETRSATIDLTFNAGNLTKEISSTLEDYISFKEGTLAYAILDSAKTVANGTTFREIPLTRPAEETTMKYYDGELGIEQTQYYTSTINNQGSYYFTYGDTISYSNQRYTITNQDGSALQAVLLSEGYETLIGKYVVSAYGYTSSTPVSGSNKQDIYYVVDATSSKITVKALVFGSYTNEKYMTYGDSYEFDEHSGYYTIYNSDGSPINAIKYNEGYDNVLIDKYIISYQGSDSSTPENTSNTCIYKVTNKSTLDELHFKTLTKANKTDSAESTLSVTEDDLGTSYYYRGGVTDNYVDFAGMCWRIVRIEGDGSVKLILEDQDQTCANSDGNWDIPRTLGGTAKTGNFGYDTSTFSGKKIISYLNPVTNANSAQVTAYKNFQGSDTITAGSLMQKIYDIYNGASLSNYLKPGNWCYNDKAYTTDNGDTEILDKSAYYRNKTKLYYDSFVRLYGKTIKEPTLKCNGTILNKYGDNTTDMYVAAITADEIAYAGGTYGAPNYNFYLYNGYNTTGFWTMTPTHFSTGMNATEWGNIFDGQTIGRIGQEPVDNYNTSRRLRPVIQLKSGITISGGVGTKANPYVIN